MTTKRNTFLKRKKYFQHWWVQQKLDKWHLEPYTKVLVNILKSAKSLSVVSAELSGSSRTALLQSTSEPVYFLKNILTDSRQQLFLWFQSIQINLIITKKRTHWVNFIIHKCENGESCTIYYDHLALNWLSHQIAILCTQCELDRPLTDSRSHI